MINLRKKLFIFAVSSLLLVADKAEAFALFDPGSMVSQVPNSVEEIANKVVTFNNKYIKGTLQSYKSLEDIISNIHSKKDIKVPGTKEIKESKIVDITDEAAIRDIFPELFFRYPSQDPNVQLAYKHKGKEFFEDTMIEAFTAVRQLEKRLVQIEEKVVKTEEDNTNSDDLNGGLNNLYLIASKTDEIMSIIQELVAIKSQMTAAYGVYGEVEPIYLEQ